LAAFYFLLYCALLLLTARRIHRKSKQSKPQVCVFIGIYVGGILDPTRQKDTLLAVTAFLLLVGSILGGDKLPRICEASVYQCGHGGSLGLVSCRAACGKTALLHIYVSDTVPRLSTTTVPSRSPRTAMCHLDCSPKRRIGSQKPIQPIRCSTFLKRSLILQYTPIKIQ
jgi:hypothetical protein